MGASFSTPCGGSGGTGLVKIGSFFHRRAALRPGRDWSFFGRLAGQDSGITGAADAADARLLRCYGVHGLDLFGPFWALFSGFAGQDFGVR